MVLALPKKFKVMAMYILQLTKDYKDNDHINIYVEEIGNSTIAMMAIGTLVDTNRETDLQIEGSSSNGVIYFVI